MERATELFVAWGGLLTAALSLYSYISHEEALFKCPLKSSSVFITTHLPGVPDGDRLVGLSYSVREQRANTRQPFSPPQAFSNLPPPHLVRRPLGEGERK